ncbi:MAG: tRNA threonylcarbamoyladenosine dehydratase [Clostridia bacterium]|nr:tRNA threonylcarbamoyladenosine dehydratase [Clostridia bacterium]
MIEEFERTQLVLGNGALEKLAKAHVAVFGIGGVGGYVVEGLARAGIGALDLIDHDSVSLSNINRQIIALHSTVGQPKVEVAKQRIADIHQQCRVSAHQCFYLPQTAAQFDFKAYDYVVDAVDTVSAKLALIERAKADNTPIISCMGTGNHLDPTAFCVADIFNTTGDPLARVMRKELKKRGIEALKVVYSKELAQRPDAALLQQVMEKEAAQGSAKRDIPGSVSFVPSVAGLIIAGEVVKDLLNK